MNSLGNFCLKWNDFSQNITTSFKELREDLDFTDVTLACEDTHIEVHKLVMASGSIFFREMLRKNKHPHPLIYFKGMKATDLEAVVDFLYNAR